MSESSITIGNRKRTLQFFAIKELRRILASIKKESHGGVVCWDERRKSAIIEAIISYEVQTGRVTQ